MTVLIQNFDALSIRKLKLLVIGGGAIVSECHLPAMQQLPQIANAAIVDISAENLARLRLIDSDITLIQKDFRQFLAEPNLSQRFDAALITLPNALHDEAIALCFAAGLDVLCEKPLANTLQRCQMLAALAKQYNRKLGVAMVRRYVPAFLLLKNSIERGLIGKVKRLEVTHGAKFTWPANSGFYFRKEHGGLLLNMGVHYLDQLQSLFGPLTPVSYVDDEDGGVECNFKLVLKNQQGVVISLQLSYTHTLDNQLVCIGESGSLSYPVGQFDSLDWRPRDSEMYARLTHSKPFQSGPWRHSFESCFIEQLADFADSILTSKPLQVDAVSAVASAALIDQCYALKLPSTEPVTRTASELRPVLAPGKVFVTGGTGFVGSKLFERLAQMPGLQRIAAIRSFMNAAPVARYDVDFNQLTLMEPDALRLAMKGCRYAFHLAYGASGADGASFTVASTRAVVEAAIACGLESIVVVSTTSVFGNRVGHVDENSPYAPSLGEYGSSKAEAERIALKLAMESKTTRVVIICPSAVYGPSGPTFTEMPAKLAKNGSFCWVNEGAGKANYVYVDNLVDALILAAQNVNAHAQRFIVSDGYCSWRAFLTPLLSNKYDIPSFTTEALQALSSQRQQPSVKQLINALLINNAAFMSLASEHRILSKIKSFAMRRIAAVRRSVQAVRAIDTKPSFLVDQMPPASPPVWLADLFGDIQTEYSAERAKKILGWTSLVSLEEGQRRSVQWLEHMEIKPLENELQER